jgi:hypothetical protein
MVLPKCTSEALSQGPHCSYATSVYFSWLIYMLWLYHYRDAFVRHDGNIIHGEWEIMQTNCEYHPYLREEKQLV